MATVFLSHAATDNLIINELLQWLLRNGFTDVFVDAKSIRTGDRWADSLRNANVSCRIVLCLVTPNWLESDECFGEFMAGWYAGKRILSLLYVGDAQLNERQIRRLNRVRLEDQGYDLTALGTPARFDSAGADKQLMPLIAGLKAGGALSHIGLDPYAFEADFTKRPDPFPGLESFGDDDADAAIFFGRSAEIATCLEDIREMRASGDRRAYTILGASGSGKSSILKAGVLPRIRRERGWIVLRSFRPGSDPLFSFSEALCRTAADHGRQWAPGTIYQELMTAWKAANRTLDRPIADAGNPNEELVVSTPFDSELERALERRVSELREASGRTSATCLVSIDQAEELVRAEAEGSSVLSDYIAAMLSVNASDGEPIPFGLVLTLRDDSFAELTSSGKMARVRTRTTDVRPLPIYRFAQAIEGPAQRYGAVVDPKLVQALIEDAPEIGALPLLAFALRRLWTRFAAERRIHRGSYEQIGKLPGLLEDAAERALRGMDPRDDSPLATLRVSSDREKRAAHVFVPGLAQINDQGQPIRRLAPWNHMSDEDKEILAPFNRWRLLVVRGQAVEVSHEALFREWPRFSKWLQPEKDRLDSLRGVESAALSWIIHGRKNEYLVHQGRRLAEAMELRLIEDYKRQIESDEHTTQYLALCRKKESRRIINRYSFAIALLIALALLLQTNIGQVSSVIISARNAGAALPGATFITDAIRKELSARRKTMREVLSRYLTLCLGGLSRDALVDGDLVDKAVSVYFKTRADTNGNDPWGTGQLAAAVGQRSVDTRKLAEYFRRNYSENCACWSPVDGGKHSAATAWVIIAHVEQSMPIESKVVETVLNRQSEDGGWPIFLDADSSPASNSSYAAALNVIALSKLGATNLIDPDLRKRVESAIARGRKWLHGHAPKRGEHWVDYPESAGRKVNSRGIHALAIFALLTSGNTEEDLAAFDAWFSTLGAPTEIDQMDTSDQFVRLGNGAVQRDGTRYLILGWELAALSRGAARLGPMERIRARRYILDALNIWHANDAGRLDFVTAETLYAINTISDSRYLTDD